MKKLLLILYSLGFCLLLNGCALFKPVDFDYGVVNDLFYRNESFGLTISAPSYLWHYKSPEAMQSFSEEVARDIAGRNLFLKAMLRIGSVNTASILHLIKYGENYNPNLLLKVNRKSKFDCNNWYQYMDKSFTAADLMNVRIERQSEDYKTEKINGKEYLYVDIITYWEDQQSPQTIYLTEQNDFYLLFFLSYQTEQHKQEMLEILRTAKFDDTYPGLIKI